MYNDSLVDVPTVTRVTFQQGVLIRRIVRFPFTFIIQKADKPYTGNEYCCDCSGRARFYKLEDSLDGIK